MIRRVTAPARSMSYRTMRPVAYLIHRASKLAPPSRLELELLDLDLAASGVHITWTRTYVADACAVGIAQRVMHDVLEAA